MPLQLDSTLLRRDSDSRLDRAHIEMGTPIAPQANVAGGGRRDLARDRCGDWAPKPRGDRAIYACGGAQAPRRSGDEEIQSVNIECPTRSPVGQLERKTQ